LLFFKRLEIFSRGIYPSFVSYEFSSFIRLLGSRSFLETIYIQTLCNLMRDSFCLLMKVYDTIGNNKVDEDSLSR
jgi:hypothetical protein